MITPNDFIQAAREGNKQIVDAYIAENVQYPDAINVKYEDVYKTGWKKFEAESALFHAASTGQLDIVTTLLSAPEIEINNALIIAAKRPEYEDWAKIFRTHIARIRNKILTHKELCYFYSSREEFNEDFETTYSSTTDYLYEKYLNLDTVYNNTKKIFFALLARNPTKEALNQALLTADFEFVEALVDAGASVVPWEITSTTPKPQTPKDKYLHLLATIPLIEKNIQFLEDNLAGQDMSILKNITFSFANLLATQEQYESAARTLYEVAANMDHDIAKHIVNSFPQRKNATQSSLTNSGIQTFWHHKQAMPDENLSNQTKILDPKNTALTEIPSYPPVKPLL